MRELDLTALAASDVVAKAAILEDCVAVAADLAIWELLLDSSCDTIFDDDALIAVAGFSDFSFESSELEILKISMY